MRRFFMPIAPIAASLITWGCAQNSAPVNTYLVTKIYDGDTVTLQRPNMVEYVRLACIDAPAMKQVPWGGAAKDYLAELIPIGSEVRLHIVDRDRQNRIVGKVYADETFVNLSMVSSGNAYVYEQYLEACLDNGFTAAEEKAQDDKVGVWATE